MESKKYHLYVTTVAIHGRVRKFIRYFDSIFSLAEYIDAFGHLFSAWRVVQHNDDKPTFSEFNRLHPRSYDPQQLDLPF